MWKHNHVLSINRKSNSGGPLPGPLWFSSNGCQDHCKRPAIRWNYYRSSRMASFAAAARLVTRGSAQPLKNPDELIDSVETFVFDCDEFKGKSNSTCFSSKQISSSPEIEILLGKTENFDELMAAAAEQKGIRRE